MLKVMIAEQVPSKNKGEATLMFGICRSITKHHNEKVIYYLCSADYESDQKTYQNDVIVLDNPGLIPIEYGYSKFQRIFSFIYLFCKHILFSFFYRIISKNVLYFFRNELWSAYISSDAIIIGHDNSFSKYHLGLIIFCKSIRKPVVIYGATVTPKALKGKLFKFLSNHIINTVDLITTREPYTFDFLKKLGVNKPPLYCTADKAFILEPEVNNNVIGILNYIKSFSNDKPLVAIMLVKGSIVLKADFGSKILTIEDKHRNHIETLAQVLDKVFEKINCQFVFIPHSIGPHDDTDDRLVHKEVFNLMKHKSNATLIEYDLPPAELKWLFGNFDMTISERTHGGIASATMNTPTLWISHPADIRTYGIVGKSIGIPECIFDISHLNCISLYDKIIWIWENRNVLKTKIAKGVFLSKEKTWSNGKYFQKHITSHILK